MSVKPDPPVHCVQVGTAGVPLEAMELCKLSSVEQFAEPGSKDLCRIKYSLCYQRGLDALPQGTEEILKEQKNNRRGRSRS